MKEPSKTLLYGILLINVLMSFVAFFAFDLPQALEGALIDKLGLNTMQVGFLYSIYAMPNLILSPFSGYFVERAGVVTSAYVFCLTMLIGQVIIAFGIMYQSYALLVIGRAFYGIGGEGMIIVQPTVNEYWFSGNMLSLSNGICQSLNFAGTMLGNYYIPKIYSVSKSLESSALLCLYISMMGCLFTWGYSYLHKNYSPITVVQAVSHRKKTEESLDTTLTDSSSMFSLQTEAPIENNPHVADLHRSDDTAPTEFGFKSIKHYSSTFWLLCLVYLFMANSFYQFTNMATELITHRYRYSFQKAKTLTVIPSIVIILTVPIISSFLQHNGKKAWALVFGSAIFVCNYLLMYSLESSPSMMVPISLGFIGFGFSTMLASLFSCVALVVPRQGLSIGYSLLSLVENVGLTSFPIWMSNISASRTIQAYNECIWMLVIFSLASLASSILLALGDLRSSGILDMPENSVEALLIRKYIEKQYQTARREGGVEMSGHVADGRDSAQDKTVRRGSEGKDEHKAGEGQLVGATGESPQLKIQN